MTHDIASQVCYILDRARLDLKIKSSSSIVRNGKRVKMFGRIGYPFDKIYTPVAKYNADFVGCKCICGKINLIFRFYVKKKLFTKHDLEKIGFAVL